MSINVKVIVQIDPSDRASKKLLDQIKAVKDTFFSKKCWQGGCTILGSSQLSDLYYSRKISV